MVFTIHLWRCWSFFLTFFFWGVTIITLVDLLMQKLILPNLLGIWLPQFTIIHWIAIYRLTNITLEKHNFHGSINYKWPCSIAMSVYPRVDPQIAMWVKNCLKPSPSHHHFYRWYGYHSHMVGLWHCLTHIIWYIWYIMYMTNFWDRYTYMYIKRLDQYNLHVNKMFVCAYIYIYIHDSL